MGHCVISYNMLPCRVYDVFNTVGPCVYGGLKRVGVNMLWYLVFLGVLCLSEEDDVALM